MQTTRDCGRQLCAFCNFAAASSKQTHASSQTASGITQKLTCSESLAVVQRDATTLEVTELPIRKWTQDYKEFLETLIKPEDKNAPALIEVHPNFTVPSKASLADIRMAYSVI